MRDRQETRFLGLKSDWTYDFAPGTVQGRYGSQAGVGRLQLLPVAKRLCPELHRSRGPAVLPHEKNLDLATDPSGLPRRGYIANRIRLSESLTAEFGLRYHYAAYTGEGRLRPRVSAAYQLSPGTTLRGAWGHYAQSQRLHELQIADGDTFFYPTQDAEHRILGLEHNLRAE